MKTNEPLGTQYVPAHRAESADSKSVLDNFIPEDCQVKTCSDYYYLASIASICATFIFPPCILVAVYCVIKAKKGGQQ